MSPSQSPCSKPTSSWGGIIFCKNHLVHVLSREYLDGDGSVVASGSLPGTPGIGGWTHFAKSNTRVRKSGRYGDEVVEEALRRLGELRARSSQTHGSPIEHKIKRNVTSSPVTGVHLKGSGGRLGYSVFSNL
jgi:hypothetical protein